MHFLLKFPYMHIETQHLHLAIPLILLSLQLCVFFSLLFLPLWAQKYLYQGIIPGQEFQGYDTAIVSAVLQEKCRAGKEAQ